MTDIRFGRLEDLPLREAWKHEAHEFTPWLAENIGHLGEAIGIQLELTGTEVAVETFRADILARNTADDTVVLIENQLEPTNHGHLGQIMTYLAGLDAQTVVWIAPSFSEPHKSAIRWLNANTADGFSFFAVKARVVRIGDSPFAPIFEVIEKPDDWSREIRKEASIAFDHISDARRKFWKLFLEKHPDAEKHNIRVNAASNHLLEILPRQLFLGRYVASETCGVYLRGPNNESVEIAAELLGPHRKAIEEQLGATFFDGGGWHACSSSKHPLGDPEGWPDAVDFLHRKTQEYLELLRKIFPETRA